MPGGRQGTLPETPALCASRFYRYEQRLGLLQIRRVKAFGAPGVERGQEVASGFPLAVVVPEPTQAARRTQLQRLRLLAVGHVQGAEESRLRTCP